MKEILFSGGVAEEIIGLGIAGMAISEIVASGAAADFPSEKLAPNQSSPALHFGYQHNFTNNFSLEAGLLWFGASFSLGKSAAAPEATISDIAIPAIPSPIISSALVGASLGTPPLNNISFIAFVYNNNHINSNSFSDEDRRILVTGTVTPAYSATQSGSKINEATTPTKITHEVEAPTSIFIRFVWKFR